MSDSGLPCVALSQLGSAAAAEVGLSESARSCSSLGGSPLPAGSLNGCIRARTECRARSWRRSSSVIVGEQQQHRRGRKRRKGVRRRLQIFSSTQSNACDNKLVLNQPYSFSVQ
ncbi:uncharacterized protein LOC128093313 [Culex pipiens pallens]|uniref:uncharacterized protein LOC128093313 n=1 Tax=Culex pipiens pallens TaxID=42434 RepID=UPI0022AA2AAF|nr:uncharacterized protein LOC128093313 [Culex pipiens pallens]